MLNQTNKLITIPRSRHLAHDQVKASFQSLWEYAKNTSNPYNNLPMLRTISSLIEGDDMLPYFHSDTGFSLQPMSLLRGNDTWIIDGLSYTDNCISILTHDVPLSVVNMTYMVNHPSNLVGVIFLNTLRDQYRTWSNQQSSPNTLRFTLEEVLPLMNMEYVIHSIINGFIHYNTDFTIPYGNTTLQNYTSVASPLVALRDYISTNSFLIKRARLTPGDILSNISLTQDTNLLDSFNMQVAPTIPMECFHALKQYKLWYLATLLSGPTPHGEFTRFIPTLRRSLQDVLPYKRYLPAIHLQYLEKITL